MEKETLLIIHGLNNNQTLFLPLIDFFKLQGYKVEFITLPCHGSVRNEGTTTEELLACFNHSIKPHTHKPYSVIAFSLGGLYLQLWLNQQTKNLPRKVILLAPALGVSHFKILFPLISRIPPFFRILSFMPKEFRRYTSLTTGEYRYLFHKLDKFLKEPVVFKIPTLLLIDPQDELINTQDLKKNFKGKVNIKIKTHPRKYLKREHGLGRHHFIVHPKYFTSKHWHRLLKQILDFLNS